VDTHGHVMLDADEAQLLTRTKRLVLPITVVMTLWLVTNGASFAAMLCGALMALAFKLSELATTYKRMSRKEVAIFVGTSLLVQVVSLMLFTISFGNFAGWRMRM